LKHTVHVTPVTSLDVKALYTSCNMRIAVELVMDRLKKDPEYLPPGFSISAMESLLHLSLDNCYFEFNNTFYAQQEGGPMGSPLTVDLAEVRTAHLEEVALNTCADPPPFYRHFVDDGYGMFRDRQHAEEFQSYINSLSSDLEYTLEHQRTDGSLPFLDVIIHADRSTSIYRKPTHTNIYLHYNSCAPERTKDGVIRSLTRRAHRICSTKHLEAELQLLRDTFLKNGYRQQRVSLVMEQTRLSISKPKSLKPPSNAVARATFPYHNTLAQPIKKILSRYDVEASFSSPPTLRNILTKTKSTPPTATTPMNSVYEVDCGDCTGEYDGQTYRPIIDRVTEHERADRLDQSEDRFGNTTSAPAKHSHDTGHSIDWNGTSILCTVKTRAQLDFAEHMAIVGRKPSMNRTLVGPRVNYIWNTLAPKICASFKKKPSDISKF
jgi:hypothetical protein